MIHTKMRELIKPAIIILVIILISGCREPTEPVDKSRIRLEAADVSVTDCILKVNVSSPAPGEVIDIQRNGITVISYSSKSDTVLFDTSLTENTGYSYKAVARSGNKVLSESSILSITTLKPSGQDFTFETFTFGDDWSPSTLMDVAIINDHNIWAVGNIYIRDSLGNVVFQPFNAVHYDGQSWKLMRIPTIEWVGPGFYSDHLEAIYARNENDMWVSTGEQMIHYNGKKWEGWKHLMTSTYDSITGNIYKIWMNDKQEAWAVGSRENVWHYSGGRWVRLKTDLQMALSDIWGIQTPSGEDKIICTGFQAPSSSKVLEVSGSKVTQFYRTSDKVFASLWFNNPYRMYMCGTGLYEYRLGNVKQIFNVPRRFFKNVKGTASNDIFVSGSVPAFAAHYNGKNFKVFDMQTDDFIYGLDYKDGIMVMVGFRDNKAVLTIGRRNSQM